MNYSRRRGNMAEDWRGWGDRASLEELLNNACRHDDGQLLMHTGGRWRRTARPFLASNIKRADTERMIGTLVPPPPSSGKRS